MLEIVIFVSNGRQTEERLSSVTIPRVLAGALVNRNLAHELEVEEGMTDLSAVIAAEDRCQRHAVWRTFGLESNQLAGGVQLCAWRMQL